MLKYIKSKIWNYLVSDFIKKLIGNLFIKNGFIKTKAGFAKVGNIVTKPIALIFWGLYEREDIYFIQKYLSGDFPVVELGASLGITTLNICKKIKSQKVVTVEANPELYSKLVETKCKNRLQQLEIISAAIDYSGLETIGFYIDKSTLSSKKKHSESNTKIPTITLSKIINQNNFNKYSLVCDIEGSEIEILMCEENQKIIDSCQIIIIELHDTSFEGRNYTIKELLELIKLKFSMNIIDQKGSTYVLA